MRSLSRWLISAVLFSAIIGNVSRADLVPENLLLVVNGDSPTSLALANEYVSLRNIPDANVVTLAGISHVEQLPVDEFRKQILGPVLAVIEERGLKSQIHGIVYSADFPSAIHVSGDVGDRKLPQVLTPVASINGLTFLHQQTMAGDVRYLDLNSNLYARRFGTRSTDTPWQVNEQKVYAESLQTLQLQSPRPRSSPSPDAAPVDALLPANGRALSAAMESLRQLQQAHPRSSELLYNLACGLATIDRNDEALATLKLAVDAGWFDHRHAARDPDLLSVHETPEFKSLFNDMKSVKLDVLPARCFRSDVGWQPNGEPSSREAQPRYLLSTVLAITAGRGTTAAEAITTLRRSASADASRPQGTVYFLRNGDVRSTTREWGFASAVERLKGLGVDAVIEEGVLPQKKTAVAGAMIGIADFNWASSDSTILPGAIVEHLTSFGGVMTKGAGQTPLTEFLRHGAAGSSGTVTEPYAIQSKFPNPFIHVHYASGATLAEAFYLSVTGPYQLLIVGDPLCSPWRRDFRLTVQAPSDAPWMGTISLTPTVASSAGLKPMRIEVYVDGRSIQSSPPNEAIAIDTRKLSDGEHQLTLVAIADDPLETISRWTGRVAVRNNGAAAVLSLTATADEHPFEQPLELKATCAGATEITINHLGRVVAKIAGDSGTASLDPRSIGSGPAAFHPVATLADGKQLRGRELVVTIITPK